MQKRQLLIGFIFIVGISFSLAGEERSVYNQHLLNDPYVENIFSTEYLGDVQVWDIKTDGEETVFVATAQGLSVYDGNRWSNYQTDDFVFFRSLAYDPVEQLLYAAGDNQLGIWHKNQFGQYQYKSIYSNPHPESPEIFWRISLKEDYVYFQTHSSVFVYTKQTGDISIVLEGHEIGYMHEVGDSLYLQANNRLLKEINGVFTETGLSVSSRIVNIFTHYRSLLYVTEDQGILYQKDEKLLPVDKTLNEKLMNARVFSAYQLNDSLYLLGTVMDGLFLVDRSFAVVNHIDYESGLKYTTVLSIHADKNNDIWLGLDGGIARVKSHPTEIFIYNKLRDIGSVYDAVWYRNTLFVATNKGLYRYEGENEFFFIQESQGQIWSLKIIDNHLYICHDKGIYRLADNKIILVHPLKVWRIKDLNVGSNYYLGIDTEGGFSLLRIQDNTFTYEKKIEGFTGSHSDVGIDRFGYIWVQDRAGCPIRIKLNANYRIEIIEKYELPGNSENLVRCDMDNEMVFFDGHQAYTYDINTNQIVDNEYYTLFLSHMLFEPIQITQIGDNFFYVSRNKSGYIKRYKDDFLNYGEIFQSLTDNVVPLLARRFIVLDEQTVAIGLQNGLVLYSIDNNEWNYKNQKFLQPEQIILETKQGKTNLPVHSHTPLTVPYDYTSLKIYFSGLYFHNQIYYSINNQPWVLSKGSPYFELPFPGPGSHTIRIKNMEAGPEEGNVAVLNLKVTSPFYYSATFYLLLLIGILLVIFIVVRIVKRYIRMQEEIILRRQQRILDKKKKEYELQLLGVRIHENEKKLVNLTMESVKRNAVLLEIKKGVALLSPKNLSDLATQQKHIIKKIDSYLNDSEAQELFDKYFNEVHNGFFDRLLLLYPDITQNEMRLCAYIKLNLTIKEIATYMNINPQSVEIARHRLRKKLGLGKNTSLQKHLSDI